MTPASPINYQQVIPDVIDAMGEVHAPMDAPGLPRSLHHLVSREIRRNWPASSCPAEAPATAGRPGPEASTKLFRAFALRVLFRGCCRPLRTFATQGEARYDR
jgi:hypothetical protein